MRCPDSNSRDWIRGAVPGLCAALWLVSALVGGCQVTGTPPAAHSAQPAPQLEGGAAAASAPSLSVSDLMRHGNQALDRGDFERAILDFGQVLQTDPKNTWALSDRALAYAWTGRPLQARADADAAAQIDPRNFVVPRVRGLLAMQAGNSAEAAADFSTSLELKPNDYFPLYNRALAYERAGEYDKALADLDAAIHVNATRTGGYTLRARVLRESGRAQEATGAADALIVANPQSADGYAAAAGIYLAAGNDVAARDALERSLALAPSVNGYLARADSRPGTDLSGRRADIDAALQLNPRSLAAAVALARVQADGREYAAAANTLDQAMAEHGETVSLLALRASVYARGNQPALAKRDIDAARAKADSMQALNSLCWNLATAGVELESALSACEAALALQPTDPLVLDSRGFVLLRLGRYDEAIASYNTALQKRPMGPDSLYGRGIARRHKGDSSGGDQDLHDALAVDARTAARFASYGVKP